LIALLDVNVLIALFDPVHGHHQAAHDWFARNRAQGWATCPLTENGFVRVICNPGYPGRRTPLPDTIHRLRLFEGSGDHAFWADSVTLCDDSFFLSAHIAGHRQLTDVYLLGLAVKNGGRLATFDRGIPISSVAGARKHHLVLIGPLD